MTTRPDMLSLPEKTTAAPGPTDWVGVLHSELPVSTALSWAAVPECGAIVTFCGAVRDHSAGRPSVTGLEYEAYEPYATRMMEAVARQAREQFRTLGRLVLLHRVGALAIGDVAVVVVTSATHRDEAYAASRFCIDTVKSTVPIWKRESWAGGSSWITCEHESQRREKPWR